MSAKEDDGDAPKSKKKTMLIVIILIVVLAAGGGAGAFFLMKKDKGKGDKAEAAAHEPAAPPVFVVLDPFTVNLQTDGGERFLQTAITLQAPTQKHVDTLKLYMPEVRNRILLLLSSKESSQISSVEGKNKLAQEIIQQVNFPFSEGGPSQEVTAVFFTSFIIQ